MKKYNIPNYIRYKNDVLASQPDEKELEVYMIGGATIAKLFLKNNLIDRFILTKIRKEYHGDTYFPLSLMEDWNRKEMISHKDYIVYEYIKH